MVRIHHILPPIMLNPVFAPADLGQVVEPPFVMLANITISPLSRGDRPNRPSEIWEVLEPVITFAENCARIIPVIIPLAVWRKVDIPHCGSTWRRLLVADKALPQVIVACQLLECFFQNRLGAVSHVFEHFPDAALIGKAHDDKAPPRSLGVL